MNVPSEPPFPTTNPLLGSVRGDTTLTLPDTTVQARVVGDGISRPGAYELPADSEIIHLVQRAGGLKPGAITEGLNWDQNLYDGLTLTIPTHQALRAVRSGTATLTNRDLIRFRQYGPDDPEPDRDEELLNLNEATREELQDLNGIGPVLSGRIIDYRRKINGFQSVSEIKDIFGIGDVTYQELRSQVKVH